MLMVTTDNARVAANQSPFSNHTIVDGGPSTNVHVGAKPDTASPKLQAETNYLDINGQPDGRCSHCRRTK